MRKFTGDLPCCRIRHLDIDPLREPDATQHGLKKLHRLQYLVLQIQSSMNLLHAVVKNGSR
jgi:hypothetical protein